MLYVDSDNALGSPRGDVDDAFALAALFAANTRIAALASVFGNTSAMRAQENNLRLAAVFGSACPCIRGSAQAGGQESEAAAFLLTRPPLECILALGPLSNLAAALARDPSSLDLVREVIVVGANYSSLGPLPPIWPFEFNLTHDRAATRKVFHSTRPLTFLPLDVAVRLRIRWAQIEHLEGTAAKYLQASSRRWFTRARWLKASSTVPIWDLVSAIYYLEPSLFKTVETTAEQSPLGKIRFGRGERPVRVVTDYSPQDVWRKFESLLKAPRFAQF